MFAQDLTINYNNSSSEEDIYEDLNAEIRFYDDAYREIPGDFGISSATIYAEPGKYVQSGDKIQIKYGEADVISGLDENTHYRISLLPLESDKVKIPKPVLEGTVKENASPTFEGTVVSAKPTTLIPFTTKLAEGVSPDGLSFTYTLSSESPSGLTLPESPFTFSGAGLFTIPVGLGSEGTYNLKLTQTAVSGEGVKRDPTVHQIVISYKHAKESFTVEVQIDGEPYKDPPEFTVIPREITFTPELKKTVTGTEAEKGNFTFTLSEGEDNPETGFKLPEETSITAQAGDKKDFSPITFTSPGTYHFKITETPVSTPGYETDSGVHPLDIEVGEEENGDLKIVRSSYGDESGDMAVFENTYKSGSLTITKKVIGKDDETRAFKFKLTLTDSGGKPLEVNYPASGVDSGSVKSGEPFSLKKDTPVKITSIPEGAKFSLEEIEIPNGYKSQIEPASGEITENSEVAITCSNTYSPSPVTFTPRVRKEVSGSPKDNSSFTFSIENKAGQELELPGNAIVEGASEGEFGPITFKSAGNYEFTIKEVAGETPGYSYDNNPVTVSVEVIDNDGTLALGEITYSKEGGTDVDHAVFRNSYSAAPGEFTPKVIKEIVGEAPESYKDFNFTLERDSDNPEGDSTKDTQSVHIGSEGSGSFNPITFTSEGTFKYHLRETKGAYSYTYDESDIVLEVVVTDVGGRLEASGTYKKGDVPLEFQDGAHFSNTYNSGTLKISKEVVGKEEDLTPFTFRIRLTEGETESKATFSSEGPVETIKDNDTFNLKNGESLTIKGLLIGMKYTITEESIPEHYSSEITPGGTGEITGSEEIALKCTNTYTPDPVNYKPIVEKQVNGSPTTSETFNFKLTKEDATEGDNVGDGLSGSISGAGSIEMPEITFTHAGVFTYKIVEEAGEAHGYTYAENEVTLTVTVTDNEGKLQVEAKYKNGEDETDKALFINTYTPDPIQITPKVKKVIEGTPAYDATFNFTLSGEEKEGYTLNGTTAQVTGQGEGTFGAIEFSQAGVYQFEIKEEVGTEPGFSYDSNTWILEVTVTDTGGILEAETSYKVKDEESLSSSDERQDSPIAGLLSTPVYAAELKPDVERANFDNTYSSGNLTIRKVLTGEAPPGELKFSFHIQLTDNRSFALPGVFTGSDGKTYTSVSDFTLSPGEEITLSEIPAGARYVVTEGETEGFRTENNRREGTIKTGETEELIFINEPDNTFSINVTKIVEGNSQEQFEFTLNLTDERGSPLPGVYRLGESQEMASGGTFHLAGGESTVISGIPSGTHYEITETAAAGYEIISDNNVGVLSADTEVTFTNRPNTFVSIAKNSIPNTGDSLLWLVGLIGGLIVIVIVLQILKKKGRAK